MSDFKLPWFPFEIDAYIGNTMTLDTEGHGAYLLLMLSYYRTGKPLPDRDRALAAIAKLPLERWLERREDIAAFFKVADGVWFHERIEQVMRDACDRHASRTASARTAAEAKYRGASAEHPPRKRDASETHPRRIKDAPSIPIASVTDASRIPDASATDPHLQEHLSIKREREARAREGFKGPSREEDIGTQIDPNFRPEEDRIERCHEDGATDETIDLEVEQFIAWNMDKGNYSSDWDSAWIRWWARWRERTERASKAAPIVHVNRTYQPTVKEFEAAAAMFAKDQSKWSHQLGPEPGHIGCKCPHEILSRFGIDPATGLAKREKSPGIVQRTG